MDDRRSALLFKAFGDENRIRILKLLGSEEKCACHLLEQMRISQPTLSHHMKLLCDAGIVQGRKEGKWMHYRICPQGIQEVRDFLKTLEDPSTETKPCCEA